MKALYVSDLHGKIPAFKVLTEAVIQHKPELLFMGGDIYPGGSGLMSVLGYEGNDFLADVLVARFQNLYQLMGADYPKVFLILGNDDSAIDESRLDNYPQLWTYCHRRAITWKNITVLGYNCIPPSPFMLKDWERYDVSRYIDPGCLSPEEGYHSQPPDNYQYRRTIMDELEHIDGVTDFAKAICLFHCPPYQTNLDRAALDGKMYDHVPLDVHIGSIAIKLFLEKKQPMLGLFGHVHESSRITDIWQEKLNTTICVNGAVERQEFALVSFDTDDVENTIKRYVFTLEL
jgi:Icc-related predicted phosphoesterase